MKQAYETIKTTLTPEDILKLKSVKEKMIKGKKPVKK